MNILDDITSFIFVEDKPSRADIIFIPGGSWPEIAERAAYLWLEGYAPYILPSGKYNPKRGYFPGTTSKAEIYRGPYESECEFLCDVLKKAGVETRAVLWEDKAQNTVENAFYSKNVADSRGMTISRAIICCKAFHARRCLMCYSWAFPETEFLVCPADTHNTTRENWFTNPEGVERVMGELMPVVESYILDDIAYAIDRGRAV